MDRILVIGGGVAAAGVQEALSSNKFAGKFHVDYVVSDSLARACSLRSTAVAALRGTRPGLSPLGDELVECWEVASKFYGRGHAGVERIRHTTWVGEDEKTRRRFQHLGQVPGPVEEEAFLIVPEVFLGRLSPRDAFVQSLTATDGGWRVRYLGGEEQSYQRVVLATGAWASWMPAELKHPKVRAVQGCYAAWDGIDLGREGFSHSFDGTNVVYQSSTTRLLLGATSVKDQTGEAFDHSELLARYQSATKKLPLPWPAWERARFQTGIRSLSTDRRPFAREIAPGLYAVGGFYKNGWVYAWRMGELIAELLASP